MNFTAWEQTRKGQGDDCTPTFCRKLTFLLEKLRFHPVMSPHHTPFLQNQVLSPNMSMRVCAPAEIELCIRIPLIVFSDIVLQCRDFTLLIVTIQNNYTL